MCQAKDSLTAAQRERLRRFETSDSVDIHCHCLPGLDDGPFNLAESLALCRALAEDGITSVVATPHQLGLYDGSCRRGRIRKAVADLNVALAVEGVELKIYPGADVRLDERIPQLLETGQIMSLADCGRYLLLELPPQTFINITPLAVELAARGVKMLVSHPERNRFLCRDPRSVLPWLEQGVGLQITAGSLLGRFGPVAETMGWYWLSKGLASLVASDAHDTAERQPCMSAAIEAISGRLGHLEAKRVCIDNPLRVLNGQTLLERRNAANLGVFK